MAFVVATRGRPRPRSVLAFMWASGLAAFQAQRSRGFLAGALRIGRGRNFLTVTVWQDAESMAAYRDSGHHRAVMHRLSDWSEASTFASWVAETGDRPTWAEVDRRLAESGWWPELDRPADDHLKQEFPSNVRSIFLAPLFRLRRR